MAKANLERGVICTVGAAQSDGAIELISSGLMVYVTDVTRREPGTELTIGHKVLADFKREPQAIGTNYGVLALRVRNYGPDRADIEALQKLINALERAGIADAGFGAPEDFLQRLFTQRLAQGVSTPLNLKAQWVELLEEKGRRFPMDSWQHDIEPAVAEMHETLTKLGVTAQLDKAPIQAAFDQHVDEVDDQRLRRHFCAAIVEAANEALQKTGHPERWHAFDSPPWVDDDEPFWLLVTPEQAAGLLREKIFKPLAD